MNKQVYKKITNGALSLVFGASVLIASSLYAQQPIQGVCGNDIHQMGKDNPEFWKAYNTFEGNYKIYRDNLNNLDPRSFRSTASGKYIIPVVFHVLHKGGAENVSDATLNSQISILNTDFRMGNSGLSGLSSHPAFDTLVPYFNGADTTYVMYGNDTIDMLNRFEFRLATLDPQGNCTDGIVRVYTEKTDYGDDPTKYKQTSYWDRDKYYNIWVVRDIVKTSTQGTILGYAQFPFAFGGQFPLTSTDGVCMRYSAMGAGTCTHETGHWLGLFHIWGDATCGSDGIDDTPLHTGPNFSGAGCFPIPKTADCYSDTATTDSVLNALNFHRRDSIGEMWMNFMDYTDDNCLWMFSELQYQKMNVTMESISFRANLSDPANLLATGTDDAAQAQQCAALPIADFWSRDGTNNFIVKKMVCANGNLTFRNGTYNLSGPNSNSETVAWDFPGGTPSTSTTTTPNITYDTPGIYDVTLTATNAEGVNTKTRTGYVHVSSNTADDSKFMYYDDFEYATSYYENGQWVLINEGVNPQNQWEHFSGAGYNSSKCMVMKNDDNIPYEQDFLISPSFDMTTITNDKLLFRYSGARKTNSPWVSQNDRLEVFLSTNCGENWVERNIRVDGVIKSGGLSGDTLYNAGLHPNGFVPDGPSDWKQGEVDITAPYNSATNLRVMFVWTSDGAYGNDFYLDQFQIVDGSSIGLEDEMINENDYKVFPNPVTSVSQIYLNLHNDADVTIDVLDVTGRMIKTIYSGALEAGESYFELSKHDVNAAGVYMVRLNVDGVMSTKKVIIE